MVPIMWNSDAEGDFVRYRRFGSLQRVSLDVFKRYFQRFQDVHVWSRLAAPLGKPPRYLSGIRMQYENRERKTQRIFVEEDEGDEEVESSTFRWTNLIFLPFHPVFELVTLVVVITKVTLGPIKSAYPYLFCEEQIIHPWLNYVRLFYLYYCGVHYALDVFLHIVHRQVAEEATRREHLPKPLTFLVMDLFGLIPFFDIVSNENCPARRLWPNMLAFSEFIVIYRVVQYFSLSSSHCIMTILFGYFIILAEIINSITCLYMLLTYHGLCSACTESHENLYDWRLYLLGRVNTLNDQTIIVPLASLVMGYLTHNLVVMMTPNTYLELMLSNIIMTIGDFLETFFVIPKLFSEAVYRFRRISKYHSRVRRVILETKRRNPKGDAYKSVVLFYSMIWKKRLGITVIPEVGIPRYMKIDTKQDVMWSIFHHSPTLRNISTGFKRWLIEEVRLEIKLPGQRFYTGPHCLTNLYYVRQGVVQFVSSDDSLTPLISVTSGTVLGDVGFYVPSINRQATVRCYTYCEVFIITRACIVKGLHKFPEDRRNILQSTKIRIEHARSLYVSKTRAIGADRTEIEDMLWLKNRWWEISKALEKWKTSSKSKGAFSKCQIPPESQSYHCPRYIGQLVLCSESQLHQNALFAKLKFPWVLLPKTSIDIIWNRIMLCTLITVLLIYPPNLAKKNQEDWFKYFQFFLDLIYITDICLSLCTSPEQVDNRNTTFLGTVVARCKSFYFFLDFLSCPWIENFLMGIGYSNYFHISHFNRLIKIYLIFKICFKKTSWHWMTEPMTKVMYQLVLIQFIVVYVGGYFFYMVSDLSSNLSIDGFFGNICPNKSIGCEEQLNGILDIIIGFIIQIRLKFAPLNSELEMFITIVFNLIWYTIKVYAQSELVGSLYLKFQQESAYYYFISHLKNHFNQHKIHPDLMKRLDRYLVCHRKYYHGMDILYTHVLRDEPYDIYWKYHGALAERIIAGSRAFAGASPVLVRELAASAKFLIMPQLSILVMFGMSNKQATWLVNGTMKTEYHNEDGELIQYYTTINELLSLSSVFFGNAALRTYTCATECEILFIPLREFFAIIQRYPEEWSCIETCIKEYGPMIEDMLSKYIQTHRYYQKKLREKIFFNRKSVFAIRKPSESAFSLNVKENVFSKKNLKKFFKSILNDPETPYVRYWMLFRMIIVVTAILNLILQVTVAASIRPKLLWVSKLCLIVGVMDILLKMVLPYYDEDSGVVISSVRKVVPHYLSRGFAVDALGTVPLTMVLDYFANEFVSDSQLADFISVVAKFPQLYLVTGYFDYLCDTTMLNICYLKIIKWQIILLLLLFGLGCFLFQLCVHIEWDPSDKGPLSVRRADTCWMPHHKLLDFNVTKGQMHLVFVEALNIIQLASFSGMDIPVFYGVKENNWIQLGVTCLVGTVFYWFIYCVTKSMIVVSGKTTNVFQGNVKQLIHYMKDERVDQSVIDSTVEYYSYWWIRTNGINLNNLMSERIGAVFREDLNYYFYKTTLLALDTLLGGGESLLRQLCNIVSNAYYLPDQDIMREMDLVLNVYVVHRGSVVVSKNGRILTVLSKGGIFGQLSGSVLRPIRVSVRAQEHTDLLEIPVKAFEETVSEDVKKKIALNPQSSYDFMATKKVFLESPYNTIMFIMRGEKTIQLPYIMRDPLPVSESVWYSRWLHFVWFWVTAVSIIISLSLNILEDEDIYNIKIFLGILDLIHFMNLISEFWTMEMVASGSDCVFIYVGLRKFYDWRLYVDVLSLILPYIGSILRKWEFHVARVLRFYMFYDFYIHFCRSFKARHKATWLKIIFVLILLHTLTCLWIDVACRPYENMKFEMPSYDLPQGVNKSINYNEWVLPNVRKGGCPRLTKLEQTQNNIFLPYFVVAKHYQIDYILSLTYLTTLHTGTNIQMVVPMSLPETYFKLILCFFIQIAKLWLTSHILSAVHTSFRKLYYHDYKVSTFIKHLGFTGVSEAVLQYVTKYTRLLWLRQKDKVLPTDLVAQAPFCLREDIYSSLYIHHLHAPELFRQLPDYFLRQLVIRLTRIVAFPGNVIVREGDVFSCIYFIHEGEVEKWYTDENGETQLASVLTMNGYFGLLPGLYPNTPYAFTYTSRTVVDLMGLTYDSWQDLSNSYPEIKMKLYETAKKYWERKPRKPPPSADIHPNDKSIDTPQHKGVETDEHMNDRQVGTYSGQDKGVDTLERTSGNTQVETAQD